ncbi:hypothetical protein JVU11DRAFT_6717 [Chiua virens]|nr:hypothetical protein JVU11DRAFT_6717 [Chiua virens]
MHSVDMAEKAEETKSQPASGWTASSWTHATMRAKTEPPSLGNVQAIGNDASKLLPSYSRSDIPTARRLKRTYAMYLESEEDGKLPPAVAPEREVSRVRANGTSNLKHWHAKTQKSARWNSDQSKSEEELSADEDSVPDASEKVMSPRHSSPMPRETGKDKQASQEEYDTPEKILDVAKQ